VLTSVSESTPALRALAAAARDNGTDFIIVGDVSSPKGFELDGCDFYELESQQRLPFAFARACPVRHYARKNVGYLLAMQRGAETILETDDDSVAHEAFWQARERTQLIPTLERAGWVNVYRYFSDGTIWPRGLPLDEVHTLVPPRDSLPLEQVACPIQQGLVDVDPDVDAVYRLLLDLPHRFTPGPGIALKSGAWCPFNSQNTTWWPEAFPLMYLPATCSMRMTDIWRSFVAQKIAWVNDWAVLFHEPTLSQERNPHDLMRDFEDEVAGYLGNRAICAALDVLDLQPGGDRVADNMRLAYRCLVSDGWLHERELGLLDAWLADLDRLYPDAGYGARRTTSLPSVSDTIRS